MKSKSKIIAFSNQKGGVGKSTSCINISAVLGSEGYRILVIDMDPQANTTSGLGIDEKKTFKNIYHCMVNDVSFDSQTILKTNFKNVDIIPSDIVLANAELELAAAMGRECILKDIIQRSNLDYDYILVDLPPNLGLLTINGLVAADEVIIPIDVSVFALSGVSQLVNVIKTVKKKLNQDLEILGAVLTKVDSRTNLSKEIQSVISDIFKDKLFKTVIHQSIKIAESQKEQKPVTYYDPKCNSSKEYISLTNEILLSVK